MFLASRRQRCPLATGSRNAGNAEKPMTEQRPMFPPHGGNVIYLPFPPLREDGESRISRLCLSFITAAAASSEGVAGVHAGRYRRLADYALDRIVRLLSRRSHLSGQEVWAITRAVEVVVSPIEHGGLDVSVLDGSEIRFLQEVRDLFLRSTSLEKLS